MGTITSGVGLISGINSKELIDQLMSLEARPKNQLLQRIQDANKQKLAWTDLSARFTTLKLSATTLKKFATFQAATATSSDEAVLTARASSGAATGSFQFQVSRLVTTQQSVTSGFENQNSLVGAGTLTIELGGGEITSQTSLAQLNGGAGVPRGAFRITDRSGRAQVIDISSDVTLDDVARRINTSLDISVRAEIDGNRLKLTDLTGQAGTLSVQDVGGGQAAAGLGIAGSAAGATLAGTSINQVGRETTLASLNDGRGVRTATTGTDFTIALADGTSLEITVRGLRTVGEALDAINTATGNDGKLTAGVAADGVSLQLTDNTGSGGTVAVTATDGSMAAHDLGLDRAATGNAIAGTAVLADINDVLLSSLRGGAGLTTGSITFTNRAGASKALDFSGVRTVSQMLGMINNDPDLHLKASLKASGNGIQIVDESGGTGSLVISDDTMAQQLGINGTFGIAASAVTGANLQRQWVSENTTLASYNGGRGVATGKIRITNSAGAVATVDLTGSDVKTLGDVIRRINAATYSSGGTQAPLGVTASINANGDGLLLTDTAGGGAKLKVEESGGTTAADLNIKGTATATAIDGSFEKTITVAADDTLAEVVDAITLPGFALTASIINDGSGATPYRLSLTARNSGRAGRVVFDAGTTKLAARTLVEAQDAVVFFGGTQTDSPMIVTSAKNQIDGMIKGVTLDLHATSSRPVTVSVTADASNVVTELKRFADTFNEVVDRIKELTAYNTETKERGLLLGEGSVQNVTSQMYAMVYTAIEGAGSFRTLADVGLSASGAGGKLELDEDKLRKAHASDPEGLKKLFSLYEKATETTKEKKGLGYLLEERIDRLVDPTTGLITRESKTIDERTESFQGRIDQLDKLLASKRTRLERQFASLESVLAKLQTQQQALASFQPISYSTGK